MTTDSNLTEYDDDPDQEIELGNIDERMDNLQDKLDRLEVNQEKEDAIEGNVMADERQLDEA